MYRSVWPLLLAVMLPLSGCAAGQENTPQITEQKEMTEQPSPISGEARTHMDITEKKQAETLQKLIEQALAADVG